MGAVLTATLDLLNALEPLPYPGRMRHLAKWARTAPDRAQVCADLREQGPYERHLALAAATVVRDAEGIAAARGDELPLIRAAALRANITVDGHGDWPATERRLLYKTLRARRMPELADGLIAEVRERFGDEEAGALLPACSAATVRALLPDLQHVVPLARLVRWHQEPLLERVRDQLTAAPAERRDRIWVRSADAVLQCDPEQVLDLLERFAPEASLPGSLRAYGRLDPSRVARLLVAPGRAAWLQRIVVPRAVLRRLRALPIEELVPLARRFRERPRALAALLDAVAPARRGELYDAAGVAAQVPAARVMEVLPAAVRIREARRVLASARVQEREAEVRVWSAHLDWAEASAALEGALRSGDAGERAHGFTLLVAAARRSRDPETVAAMMGRLDRLGNEQDPVRSAALIALARVARLLTGDTAAQLTKLTTDAVEARDCSAATTNALSSLAADVLQHHVDEPRLREWALLTIDRVSSDALVPVLRRFDLVLRRGQEMMVFDRLRGWVEAAIARGRYGPLFALTHALGKRAWGLPALQELLRRAFGPDTLASVASTAIGLWLADPRTRADRVETVLDTEPTAVTIHRVWETICGVRTDLLDRALDQPRGRSWTGRLKGGGRFLESGKRWVPGWAVHTERWLPRQQRRFVELQELVIADPQQTVWQRAAAIRAAAVIPGLGGELVRRYLGASEVTIAEAALGALVWTDRPDAALPVLLREAGTDRARVALYSAGRAARYTPPSGLVAPLGAVLTGAIGRVKVTSRKEAARLLAYYGPPESMEMLLRAYTDPEAHRDVRAAIVSAARQRLEAAASWTILRTAADGSREERRAVLAADPETISERHRPRYGEFVVSACQVADREVARAAFGRLGEWSPWLVGVADLVVGRLAELDESMVDAEVAALLRAGSDQAFGAAVRLLLAHDAADDRPGDPITDRPARRRIALLAAGAALLSAHRPAADDRGTLIEAARHLAGHASFAGTGTALLVDLGRLDNLPEIADLCAERPVLALHTAGLVGTRLHALGEEPDPAMVEGLAARGDLAGGLFALSLVSFGASLGWKPPWRDLLLELRRHADPEVRAEAYAIDMA
ncbi:hypothetical protein [Actinoplanes sp. NPDC051859]|uniref:hypothetical protein n=1 Tax=Actinoplanes sp. NPDC051859 TaxID=3363909 RepID=UPI0037A929A6